jgi:hypothetical protein
MDLTRIRRGEISWDVEGYLAALKWRCDLWRKPRDDWEKGPATVPPLGGEPLDFDHHRVSHQLFRHLTTKYDPELAAAHWWRLNVIDEWGPRHEDKLIRMKLMRRDRAGGWEFAMNLYQAFTELPFTRIRRDGSRTFSMREFRARIEELIEAEHAELDRRRGR